jgi:hypothetical protein
MLPFPKLDRQMSIQPASLGSVPDGQLGTSDRRGSVVADTLDPIASDQEDDSKFDVAQEETVFSGRGLSILPILARRYASIDPSAPTEIQSGFVSSKLLGLQRYFCSVIQSSHLVEKKKVTDTVCVYIIVC